MGIDIQRDILGLKGQCVNQIKLDEQKQQLVIHCNRDRRRNAVDPVSGRKEPLIGMSVDKSGMCPCLAILA